MKCLIPGANVKVFGKAIHSLSRIGEELYFEPLEHGLAIRTVNASRSAYACFVFAPTFFLSYDDGSGEINSNDSEEEVLKCKIGMKSCLSVFKSLSVLEKTVEKCKIKLDSKESRLIFQLYCRHGIVKTYNLAFIECETLQAVYTKDLTPDVLKAQTKLLCDVVVNFQTTQEEVSLIVNPQKATFKNYVEDEPDPTKVIHTEMSLVPEEFDSYQVGRDTEVTFCLKELRAVLGFSEHANLPISIHFESPGKPIVFSIDSDPSFEGTFVLATLADKTPSSQIGGAPQALCSTQHNTTHHINHRTPASRTSSHLRKSQHQHSTEPTASTSKAQSAAKTSESANRNEASFLQRESENNEESTSKTTKHKDRCKSARLEAAYKELCQDENFDDEVPMDTTTHFPANSNNNHKDLTSNFDNREFSESAQVDKRTFSEHGNGDVGANNKEKELPGAMTLEELDEEMPSSPVLQGRGGGDGAKRWTMSLTDGENARSPVIPFQSSKKTALTKSLLQSSSDDEEEEELVPGTPPKKRFRSLFYGLSQSTTGGSQPIGNVTVLAEDSDED